MNKPGQFMILAGLSVSAAVAQVAPAPVLNILQEFIKEGKGPAHDKVETEWAAWMRSAKAPGYYLAYSQISGGSQMWFVDPLGSFAESEENAKAYEKEPLKSGSAALETRDGEARISSRTIWAVYRPDMSYNTDKFSPEKYHYFNVRTFHIKVGHQADFAEAVKLYIAASAKARIGLTFVCYQVTAGMDDGTFMFYSGMESLKQQDEGPQTMQALITAMGSDKFAQFDKNGENFISSFDNTLLRARPELSYAPPGFITADPGFWKPKPVVKPAK